jgi:hypothetical protein
MNKSWEKIKWVLENNKPDKTSHSLLVKVDGLVQKKHFKSQILEALIHSNQVLRNQVRNQEKEGITLSFELQYKAST